MIVSYRDKRTRDFAAGKRVKAFSRIERSAQRICFEWPGGSAGPAHVEIVDYH